MPTIKRYFADNWLFLLIFTVLTVIYLDYLKADGLIGRDDTLMVQPLLKTHSLSDYVSKVAKNEILDIQPVRDLTFLINIKIHDWLDFSTFHGLNLILFFVAIYLFSNLLKALEFSFNSIIVGTLIFSFHPLMVSAVGWIASRKHTLALIFILLTILEFVKKKDVNWKTSIYFLLSVMSHQIFFLFPIWVWFYARLKDWKINRSMLTIMTCLAWIFVGIATYKTFYINIGDVYYTDSASTFDNISRYILSIGRSFILMAFPYSISTIYSQGSLWNIIGIPLLILTVYVFYKGKAWRSTMPWLFLAILAHLPTYIAFINDTYLYLGLICLIIATLYQIEALTWKISSKLEFGLKIFIISLLGLKTIDAAPMWKSMDRLWHYSFNNEPSAATGIYLSQYLQDEKEQMKLLHWSGQSFNFRGNLPMIDFFVTKVYTSSLEVNEKIKIFEDCYFEHPLYKAYYGLMLLEGNDLQTQKGIEILQPILQREYKYFYPESRVTVLKALKYVCQNFKGKEMACHKLNVDY